LFFGYFRYISVLPPINLQYKVKNLQDLQGPAFHYSEKFYQEFSKDLRRTSQSYAVELAGFVKILYLITGIFIIVTVYLIYQLLSNPKKRKPIPNVIFLDGHQQVFLHALMPNFCAYRSLYKCLFTHLCDFSF
jgi:hypothetical protein